VKRSIQPAPPVWTAPVVPAAGALLLAGVLVGTAGTSGSDGGLPPSEETLLLLALLPLAPIAICLLFRLLQGNAPPAGNAHRPGWHSLLVSLVLALPLAWLLTVGTVRASRPAVGALPSAGIVRLSGRARTDLRPSSDAIRVLPLTIDRVETRDGWSGSAAGTVRLLWRGDTSLVDPDGSRRVVPIRGDRIDVLVPAGGAAGAPGAAGAAGATGAAGAPGANDATEAPGATGAEAGLSRVVWVENEDLTCRPGPSRGSSLRRSARDVLRNRLARLPAPSNAFVTALLLGDRAGMDAEVVAAVRRAGASHVIALSGMHLGVLAVILGSILRRVAPRWITHPTVALVLIAYVWIVGWIPSLLRALVLLILLTAGELADRGTVAEISLARCTLLVAALSPTLLSEAGFVLSILALVGLFTLAPLFAEGLGLILPTAVARGLAVPIGALAATAPYSLLTFGSVYPVGIVSAGVLALLVVAIMWGSLLYLGVATVPYLGTLLITLLDGGVRLFLALCQLFARVPGIGPGSGAGVAQTAGWCTLIAAVGLVVAILRRRRRRRTASALERYDQPQLDF
jgi:ComEC/Rec2-related protein